jgi:MFS family permease
MPIYPLYPLLFADHGLSGAAITSLFALWSVVAFAAEVPSGALADSMSRRRLLTIAMVLRAIGFALWVLVPNYAGFAVGFVLWGVGGAFTSGTEQALVYDELAAIGRGSAYAGLMGRAGTLRLLGNASAVSIATPLYALGGYPLLGAVSVLVSLLNALVAASLPEAPRVEETGEGSYWATLRSGVREAARHRVVRRLLLLGSLLPALWAVEEYLPLLAGADGVPAGLIPLVLLPQLLVQAGASALAGRTSRLAPRLVGGLLGLAAGLLSVGALVRNPVGVLLIAVPLGILVLVEVLLDARLQDAIEGGARATVTSVAGFGSEALSVGLFGAYAAGSAAGLGVNTLVAAVGPALAAVAVLTARWLPRTRPRTGPRTGRRARRRATMEP